MTKFTAEEVRELLDYEPTTGSLTWKARDRKWFKNDGAWKAFNTSFAGRIVRSKNSSGYLRVNIKGTHVLAHRIVWLHQTGCWPEKYIDHINHNPADNSWSNLREVSHTENHQNQSRRSDNTSGITGVSLRAGTNRWTARIKTGGKYLSLGSFERKEDAVMARMSAETLAGFHPNHGKVFNENVTY